ARHLFPPSSGSEPLSSTGPNSPAPDSNPPRASQGSPTLGPASGQATGYSTPLVDVGSGAGFPGLPIKIWSPNMPVVLIESNQKKVAFLREVARALALTSLDVSATRAEDYPANTAATVTLRAVERFSQILPTAIRLLAPKGRLALLISEPQLE